MFVIIYTCSAIYNGYNIYLIFLFNKVNTLSEKNKILEEKINEIHTFMKFVFDATPGQIDYLNAQNRFESNSKTSLEIGTLIFVYLFELYIYFRII